MDPVQTIAIIALAVSVLNSVLCIVLLMVISEKKR